MLCGKNVPCSLAPEITFGYAGGIIRCGSLGGIKSKEGRFSRVKKSFLIDSVFLFSSTVGEVRMGGGVLPGRPAWPEPVVEGQLGVELRFGDLVQRVAVQVVQRVLVEDGEDPVAVVDLQNLDEIEFDLRAGFGDTQRQRLRHAQWAVPVFLGEAVSEHRRGDEEPPGEQGVVTVG